MGNSIGEEIGEALVNIIKPAADALQKCESDNAALRARVTELQERMFSIGDGVSVCADFVEAAFSIERERAEKAEARMDALKKYVRHVRTCGYFGYDGKCTCGLDVVLAECG